MRPTSSAPDALSLDQIAAMWPAVVEIVRGANMMLAVLLSDARPLSVTDRELTLALSSAFNKKKAESDEHRRTVADAVRNVTGSAIAVRYELAGPEHAAVSAPSAAPAISEEELVQRFMEEFSAQEIEEETS